MIRYFEIINLNKTSAAKLTCPFLRTWPHYTWPWPEFPTLLSVKAALEYIESLFMKYFLGEYIHLKWAMLDIVLLFETLVTCLGLWYPVTSYQHYWGNVMLSDFKYILSITCLLLFKLVCSVALGYVRIYFLLLSSYNLGIFEVVTISLYSGFLFWANVSEFLVTKQPKTHSSEFPV